MGETRVDIPPLAYVVNVINIANPTCMIAYKEANYTERLKDINDKLHLEMRKIQREKMTVSASQLQLGDVVILRNNIDGIAEFSSQWARGVSTGWNEEADRCRVFLPDHGYVVEASLEDLTPVSDSFVPDECLTFTLGLDNVLPLRRSKSADCDTEAREGWSEAAIQLTQQIIAASTKTYFDHSSSGDENDKYGELYLVLEDDVVRLSEILIANEYAIHLSVDWLKTQRIVRDRDDRLDRGIFVSLKKPHREKSLRRRKDRRHEKDNCEIFIDSRTRCDRLTSLGDARFPPRIHATLKSCDIVALRKIQTYVFPAVSKGFNVVAVGPQSCGKTIGYVFPVVSSLVTAKNIPKGRNPSVLILCSSTSDVLSIAALCNQSLEYYDTVRCVAGWNGRANRSLVADIYNGCQILIATPAFLTRFVGREENKKVINFENLSYLVMDGLDVILEKYAEALIRLLKKNINIDKRELKNDEPLQIIAVAREWSSRVTTFTKECIPDPYICIGSYIDAVIFAGTKPKLIIVKSTEKMKKLIELLDDRTLTTRTMVVCRNAEEARLLNDRLSETRDVLMACEDTMYTETRQIRECWRVGVSGMFPVLVCSDEALYELKITDVQWLVHFSLPLTSKSLFYDRFSSLINSLKEGECKGKVTIMIDESNDVQLYGSVSVVERCGTKILPQLMDAVMKITSTLDRQKSEYPICDNVRAFGTCPNVNSCPYRHCVLVGVDEPVTPIQSGDNVVMKVTCVHDATHFSARIMEYVDSERKVTKYSAEEFTKFASKVQTYYADKSNRRCHRGVKVGELCAVEESLDHYQRAKVLHIVKKDSKEAPLFVRLKCIDSGEILERISATRLMEIPEDLGNHKSHILDIFLAGLLPFDDEFEWNYRAMEEAHAWFPDRTDPNAFVVGKVQLHLGDVLWVDPLEVRIPIIGHPHLTRGSLKRHMVRLKHGIPNETHLKKLHELCRLGGATKYLPSSSEEEYENPEENEE